MTQSGIDTTLKEIIDSFNDKFDKQHEELASFNKMFDKQHEELIYLTTV